MHENLLVKNYFSKIFPLKTPQHSILQCAMYRNFGGGKYIAGFGDCF